MSAKMIGRYVVSDPEICHGKPTFRGTRMMVAHLLEQVAEGMDWESIVRSGVAASARKPLPRRCAWQGEHFETTCRSTLLASTF